MSERTLDSSWVTKTTLEEALAHIDTIGSVELWPGGNSADGILVTSGVNVEEAVKAAFSIAPDLVIVPAQEHSDDARSP